jgi:hypothetical protein
MMDKQEMNIVYKTIPGFDDLATYEAIAEGLTQRNHVFFTNFELDVGLDDLLGRKAIRYEEPRMNGARQTVGDAAIVLDRGFATCLDWAALCAGYARAQGRSARVVVVPLVNGYGDEVAGSYHALVESDSGIVDVCAILPGYDKRNENLLPNSTVQTCCVACSYDGTLATKRSCSDGTCNSAGNGVGACSGGCAYSGIGGKCNCGGKCGACPRCMQKPCNCGFSGGF